MWPLMMALALPLWSLVQGPATDASKLTFGAPVPVAEVDTSKLKGEVRRLAWNPDGTRLYLQSVEGKPPDAKIRHFLVDVAGGALVGMDSEPDWAAKYWAVKQDRVAPGIPSLVIDVQQGIEKVTAGPGASGVLDRQSSPDAVAGGSPSAANIAEGSHGNQNATVVRLKLVDVDIAVWINERPFPGAKFSWGPEGSGALVFTGPHGELIFLDRQKRRQEVPEVKDAFLPAWSADGSRLAFLRKAGRKKLSISWLPVSR